MLDSKTRAVTKWARPRITKQVRGLHGLMCYYRKFIQHYAHITLPLYQMCKMRRKDKMGGRHGEPWLKGVGTVQLV
jgi:hypothetical protein